MHNTIPRGVKHLNNPSNIATEQEETYNGQAEERQLEPSTGQVDLKGSPVECRPGCAACCIAPSISSPIPGMPTGKPAGVRCIQLTEDNKCKLFGSPSRPRVCGSLKPVREMCGRTSGEALRYLEELEKATSG